MGHKVRQSAASAQHSAKEAARAGLYDDIELLVLERMRDQLRDPACAAQVLQAAVSMLRAGGVQARGASQGLESGEERAVKGWLESMPAADRKRLLEEKLTVKNPRPKREREDGGAAS